MFTGIVTDVGEVVRVEKRGDTRFTIATAYAPESIAVGASIACSGCCLTAIEMDRLADGRGTFIVEASAETLTKTTLSTWKTGTRINLERSLKMGDELGGHIVSGHVDGLGEIVSITPEGDSKRFRFKAPNDLAHFIAPKGSVTQTPCRSSMQTAGIRQRANQGQHLLVGHIRRRVAVSTILPSAISQPG